MEHSNTANNKNFHYRTNSVKINGKIFQYIQKTCFWPIFGAKIFFQENPALSCITSYGFLAPCQNLEKTNDTIPRKCTDRGKGGQTYRTLLAAVGGPKIISLFVHLILSAFSVGIIHDGI